MREILVIRLGAMGDVIHVLPAVAALRESFPQTRLTWIVEPRWMPLIDSVLVHQVIPLNRRKWASVRQAWASMRVRAFDLAIDFQGLIKSALVAKASGAARVAGYANPRETPARWFYDVLVKPESAHIVDHHLELAQAIGAAGKAKSFPLPAGTAEGTLPAGRFVLACPFAGWASKEWPLDRYAELGRLLAAHNVRLVLNGHPAVEAQLRRLEHVNVHISSIAGLIDATRRASAVLGLDSGPLHLAAALQKPGVALFGPTDPARNGPYGSTIRVLRSADAVTSYKRLPEVDPSMLALTPAEVDKALLEVLS